MKKLLIKSILFSAAFITSILAQSLDEIIDRHFDAVHQDKFNNLKTVIIKYSITGGEAPEELTITYKRPYSMRTETITNGKTTISAFDGNSGWHILPGSNKPKAMTKEEIEKVKYKADLDGYFFCWRQKGHDLKLEGKVNVDGKQCYKINCTKVNGEKSILYMDAKNFLLNKIIQNPGTNEENEILISNYKKTDGVMFPFMNEIKSKSGSIIQKVVSLEFNKEISDSTFAAPKTELKID